MNPLSTPLANPSLSFLLTGGKAVETSADSSSPSSHIAQLTAGLAAGDEAAFRQFHAQYFSPLYRFLLVVTHGQDQEAQDALQHTFLRVVRYVRRFESEDVFWAWLKAVARSAARDGNRKQQRYSLLLQRFSFEPPAPGAGGKEESYLAAVLEESLIALPPEDRRLLEAKYIEGFTVKELGAQTGMTEKAVESRLERLRRTLRERVLKELSAYEK